MSLAIKLLIFAALAIVGMVWEHFDLKRKLKQAVADIKYYDELNAELRDEINYKLQNIGMKRIEVKRYICEYDVEDCRIDVMRITKAAVLTEVCMAAKEMCEVIARPKGAEIEVCGRLIVGVPEE